MAVEYRVREEISFSALSALFQASWEGGGPDDYGPTLARSLAWVSAYDGGTLVGFVNVAWDGGAHAFLLDTTVHPRVRRCGVGGALVRLAIDAARRAGVEWLHVDYERDLGGFYEKCGFRATEAGIIRLRESGGPPPP